MSFFVNATEAKQSKTTSVQLAGLALAALFTILALGQLFTFERFADVLYAYGFFANEPTTLVIAALIVTFEIAPIPFLLRMKLSPLARIISMVAGWVILLFWLFMSFWLNITISLAPNSGVLGDTIKLPVGWWMVTFFTALSLLSVCASYGMWPVVRRTKKA